jgi:pimeloyl-ACP methyl ester carboxylesterase
MTLIQTATGATWTADQRAVDSDLPVMILLHGAGGTHLQWPRELRRLRGVQVVAPDLTGHGRSPAPGRDSIAAYAGDVLALMKALSIDKAIIGGHSMGAAVALQLALDTPARVQGLVLMGAGAKLAVAPGLLDDAKNAPERAARTFVDWVWSETTSEAVREESYEALMRLQSGVFYGDFAACQGFDVRERLGEIATPTLIIGATRDRMTPPKYAEYLHAHIAGSQLVIVEAAHMMMLEAAGDVGSAVQTWLETGAFVDSLE